MNEILVSLFSLVALLIFLIDHFVDENIKRKRQAELHQKIKEQLDALTPEERTIYAQRISKLLPTYDRESAETIGSIVFQYLWDDYKQQNHVQPIVFERTVRMWND